MELWTRLTDKKIEDIGTSVGVRVEISSSQTLRDKRNKLRFRLFPLSDTYRKRKAYSERRVNAVCWHGHEKFMIALFEADPKARLKTMLADYNGIALFYERYPPTAYTQVGSMMYPAYAYEECDCALDGMI